MRIQCRDLLIADVRRTLMRRFALSVGALLLLAAPCVLAAILWYYRMMEDFPLPGPEPRPDMSASWSDYLMAAVAFLLFAGAGIAMIRWALSRPR